MDSKKAPKEAPKVPAVAGPSATSSVRSTPRISGTIIYQFPYGFPPESQNRVKLAEIAAKQQFNDTARDVQREFLLRKMRITCLMQPTKTLVTEAIRLGWGVNTIYDCVRDFVLRAAGWAGLNIGTQDFWDEIEASPEWKEYEEMLKGSTGKISEALPESSGTTDEEGPPSRNQSAQSTGTEMEVAAAGTNVDAPAAPVNEQIKGPSTPTPSEGPTSRVVQEEPKQDAPERIDDGSPPTGTVPVPEQPQRIAAIPGPAAEAHTLVPPRPCEQHDEVPGRQATPTKNRPVEAEAHITLEKAATGTALAPEDDAAEELGSGLERRKAERMKLRDDYKAECKRCGVHVTYESIANGACPNWKSRSQIDKWLQCDWRYDGEPDRLIRQYLTREIERLRQLPSKQPQR